MNNLEPTNSRDQLNAAFRYALALCHQENEAADLVQQACSQLIDTRQHQPNKRLLFSTIRDLYLQLHNRHKLAVIETCEPHNNSDVCPITINLHHMEAALRRLRMEEREVLFLNIFETLSVEEIAEFTQLSRNTVTNLLRNAKQRLHKLLQGSAVKIDEAQQ